MKIVFIGAGNVATHLAKALDSAEGCEVVQIYSRTLKSARELSEKMDNATATNRLSDLVDNADMYIISVADDSLPTIINELPENNALWVHTSGSVGMEVFKERSTHGRHGVFYPLQTFSKSVELEMSEVPMFIEGETPAVEEEIRTVAEKIFKNVYHADSDTRRMMHIAAVFGCNFVNYLWSLSEGILKREGLSFNVLQPLLKETMRKAFAVSPSETQTGPAARKDRNIIDKHLSMLEGDEKMIYLLLSESIMGRDANETSI